MKPKGSYIKDVWIKLAKMCPPFPLSAFCLTPPTSSGRCLWIAHKKCTLLWQFWRHIAVSRLLRMTLALWIEGDAVSLARFQVRNANVDIVVAQHGRKTCSRSDTLTIGIIWPRINDDVIRRPIERWRVRQHTVCVVLGVVHVSYVRDFNWHTQARPIIDNNHRSLAFASTSNINSTQLYTSRPQNQLTVTNPTQKQWWWQ